MEEFSRLDSKRRGEEVVILSGLTRQVRLERRRVNRARHMFSAMGERGRVIIGAVRLELETTRSLPGKRRVRELDSIRGLKHEKFALAKWLADFDELNPEVFLRRVLRSIRKLERILGKERWRDGSDQF